MVTQRSVGLHRLFLFCQVLIVAGLFWFGVWVMVTFYSPSAELTWRRYSTYCGLLVLGIILEFLTRSPARNYVAQNEILRQHRLSLRQTIASVGTLVLYLIATKDAFISRVFFFNFVPWLYVALVFSHYYIPEVLAQRIFSGVRQEKTLLVGSHRKASLLGEWLRRKAAIGIKTIGLVCDEPLDCTEDGVRVLGNFPDVERIIRENGITQVILLEIPSDSEIDRLLVSICDRLAVRLFILSDLEERLRHSITHFEDDGFRFIGLREEPLENPVNRFCKRAIDLAVALPMVIVVLPPLAVLVWVGQRLQSPGPLIHKQVRAGLQNRQFTIYKFRTMRTGHARESEQAMATDARVYPLGKLLRKFSLDELPQFWNVIRGDMSIVGPRPHLLEHNRQFAEQLAQYHVRTFVKPGITGLAQVRGYRGEAHTPAAIENRVTCDIEYLENWNLSLEFGIILRTLFHLVRPPATAY